MDILVPTASPRDTQKIRARSVGRLDDKRVGIVSNGWRSMDAIMARMSLRLQDKYGVREVKLFAVHINKPIAVDMLDKVAAECDAAIVGLAN